MIQMTSPCCRPLPVPPACRRGGHSACPRGGDSAGDGRDRYRCFRGCVRMPQEHCRQTGKAKQPLAVEKNGKNCRRLFRSHRRHPPHDIDFRSGTAQKSSTLLRTGSAHAQIDRLLFPNDAADAEDGCRPAANVPGKMSIAADVVRACRISRRCMAALAPAASPSLIAYCRQTNLL